MIVPLIRSWLERLLDLLFPEQCLGCRRLGTLLCTNCRRTLQPYPHALPQLPPLAGAYVGYVFDGPLRRALHQLKYRRQRRVADVLAEILVAQLAQVTLRADAIIPVPLHAARLQERGFNQSELIGRGVAARLGLPVITHGLIRAQATRSQVGLHTHERQQNVAGAFIWQEASPPPSTVLLIDDVLTTGATLCACADALLLAGCRRVEAIAVARSQPNLDPANARR